MSIDVCIRLGCLFITEFSYNMDETNRLKRLLESSQNTTNQQDYISQVLEFEKFLADMKISVKKKQLISEREDSSLQIVYLNQ